MNARYPYHEWKAMAADEAQLRSAACKNLCVDGLQHLEDRLKHFTGLPWRFHLDAVAGSYSAVGECLSVVFEDATGSRISVALDPALVPFLVERVLGAESTTLPSRPSLIRNVDAGVLLYLAAKLPLADGDWTVRDCRVKQSIGDSVEHDVYLGTLQVGAASGWCRLHFQPARAALPMDAASAALPLSVRLDAGIALFPAASLEALEPGDVVCANPCWLESLAPIGGRLRLQVVGGGASCWIFRINDGSLFFEQVQEVPMSTSKEALEANRTAPVEVSVELARFTLPLEELATLTPGEVLRTKVQVGTEVQLRAGEEILAVGELVNVDGEVGVEIRQRRPTA